MTNAYDYAEETDTATTVLSGVPSLPLRPLSVATPFEAGTWEYVQYDPLKAAHAYDALDLLRLPLHHSRPKNTEYFSSHNCIFGHIPSEPARLWMHSTPHARLSNAARYALLICDPDQVDSTTSAYGLATVMDAKADTDDLIVQTPVRDLLAGYEQYEQPNWDYYGADPITPATVNAARAFLRLLPEYMGEPAVAPGSDGTIGFEWIARTGPLRKLFIDIGPNLQWSGYWRRADGTKDTIDPSPIDETTNITLHFLLQRITA